MKQKVLIVTMLLILLACKTEKKEGVLVDEPKVVEVHQDLNQKKSFEHSLLDLRATQMQFTEGYRVDKFGVQMINDSIYRFVFKINNLTNDQTVLDYSLGVICYDKKLKKPLKFSYSPNIETHDNIRYISIPYKIREKNIRYFDSIEAYVYARKNWKASGRLAQ